MKVFITGATGFIGSRVLDMLLKAGHEVTALVRKREDAERLKFKGVEAVLGDLTSLDVISQGAKSSDAVLHLAFIHDFENYEASCAVETHVLDVINDSLAGNLFNIGFAISFTYHWINF